MILGLVGLYATGVAVTAGIEVAGLALYQKLDNGPEATKISNTLQDCRKIDIVEAVCEMAIAWPKFWYNFAKYAKRKGSKNEEKNENDAV